MSKAIGVDCGTMFFQTAEHDSSGNIVFSTTRNAFVELPKSDDTADVLKRNGWNYCTDGEHYFVVGEDALKVAKMFPDKVELRRPLQDGVLNKSESKKSVVLSEIIEKAIGNSPDNKSVVATCISSESVDGSVDSEYHKVRLESMFSSLGWNVSVIEEGLAVIMSERPIMVEETEEGEKKEVPYSGIGISFGAGRVNCVLAYRGMKVIGMSCARSGDWIDKKVAEATGKPLSQVISFKERKLDFKKIDADDEENGEVAFGYDAYYTAAIKYVMDNFARMFQTVKSKFEAPMDIVVAGGTSMPKGFLSKFEKVVRSMGLPMEIREVRHAADPRNAVVKGLLIEATRVQRKLEKKGSATNEVSEILGE